MDTFKTIGQAALAIADGIARGEPMLSISGASGIDRSTLRVMVSSPGAMEDLASAIGTPSKLSADALAILTSPHVQKYERNKAAELRRKFHRALIGLYPEWFARREAEAERKRVKAAKEDARISGEVEAEAAAAERRRIACAECSRADFWNLKTVVEIYRREWDNGTPDEIERGLVTPEARKARRLKSGMRYSTCGFGPYYAKSWSACRCRMEYAERGMAHDPFAAFREICTDESFAPAWDEINAENDADEYFQNPFVRRDRNMPTDEDGAKSLYAFVSGGGTIAEWTRRGAKSIRRRNECAS